MENPPRSSPPPTPWPSAGGATKDKTVVTDQKEEKKAEEKKTEEKVQTETNEELIKTRTERDIFKKLYEQMTERLLERRE
jgi:hypothetical protein